MLAAAATREALRSPVAASRDACVAKTPSPVVRSMMQRLAARPTRKVEPQEAAAVAEELPRHVMWVGARCGVGKATAATRVLHSACRYGPSARPTCVRVAEVGQRLAPNA